MHAGRNAPREPVSRIDTGEDIPRLRKIRRARRRQLEAAWRALEQRRADRVFEILDLAGDRRLRDMQLLGGGPHAAQFGNSNEIAKMSKLHGRFAQDRSSAMIEQDEKNNGRTPSRVAVAVTITRTCNGTRKNLSMPPRSRSQLPRRPPLEVILSGTRS